MKALQLKGITHSDEINLTEVPVPKTRDGWVLVRVKAFGMNHSEKILRLSEIEADYIRKPIIPGIELAGIVEDPSDTDFRKGDVVISMMGGLGRSFDGSYAEYALVPAHHLFKVETSLSWDQLGAVPETFFTAWGSLFECLHLEKSDTLLIRGATSALGYAAIRIAKALGAKVIATTHRNEKLSLLDEADIAMVDTGHIERQGITKVLELVGPRTVPDSLYAVEKGGIVCSTGILGGVFTLNGFDPIKAIPNGVYLTGFFSNYPDKKTVDDIFSFIEEHKLKIPVGKVFSFSDLLSAVKAQDEGSVNGKIVVVMEDK